MKRAIPPAKLMPGDILLYRGVGLVSDAIRFIDRSQVSHSAVFLGRHGEMGCTVGEAIREGVVRRELPKSTEHAEWVESRRLKAPPATLEPVLERAACYLERGERYAFEQILLLAFLCITRSLAGSSALGRFLRVTLDAAAEFLLQLVRTGREPMICSEFVCRCYREGLPGSLDVPERVPKTRAAAAGKMRGIRRGSALAAFIDSRGGAPAEGVIDLPAPAGIFRPADASAVDEAIRDYLDDVQKRPPRAARIDLESPGLEPSFGRFSGAFYRARIRPGKGPLPRTAAMDALFEAAADFVTPGDLHRSRSLAFCGKLKKKE
jgi:hypothetical protein